MDELVRKMEEDGISAKEAVRRLAQKWELEGKRPAIDEITEQVSKKEKLGILKPKMREGLNMVGASTWKKLRFCLDSGAGEIVIAEDDLPEVETKESWGSRHGQSYDVANGDETDNEGENNSLHTWSQ